MPQRLTGARELKQRMLQDQILHDGVLGGERFLKRISYSSYIVIPSMCNILSHQRIFIFHIKI